MTRVHEARTLAAALYRRGFRNASYAAHLCGVNKRSMRRYFAKLRRGESLELRVSPGRPLKMTHAVLLLLARIKTRHPFESALFYTAQLARRTGSAVSVRSVRRALHRMGYSFMKITRRVLTSSQRAERVAFARARFADLWDDRWSFDEATFNLYRLGNRCWVRILPRTGDPEPSLPKMSRKLENVSVSVVAAVSRGKKSALGFLPGGWTGADLVRVFSQDVYTSLRWRGSGRHMNELMCDNDGRHHTHEWRDYLLRTQISRLDPWPSNSPDLNPIEHVWAWMKAFVQRVRPESEHELRQAIRAAWGAYPLAATAHLMDSMSSRLARCLEKHGGRLS